MVEAGGVEVEEEEEEEVEKVEVEEAVIFLVRKCLSGGQLRPSAPLWRGIMNTPGPPPCPPDLLVNSHIYLLIRCPFISSRQHRVGESGSCE